MRRADAAAGSVGGAATLASMPELGRVTQLAQVGEMPVAVLGQTITQLEEGCKQLLRKMRTVLCDSAAA